MKKVNGKGSASKTSVKKEQTRTSVKKEQTSTDCKINIAFQMVEDEVDEATKEKVDAAFNNPELLKQFHHLQSQVIDPESFGQMKSEHVILGINNVIAQVNESENLSMHIGTINKIRAGRGMVILKMLVRREGTSWKEYAGSNIKYISERTRQKWMSVSKCPVAVKYAHLGIERLDCVWSARRYVKDADPIGPFLNQYKIVFDPKGESELTVAEFKSAVDIALDLERSDNENLDLKKDLIEGIVAERGRLKNADWIRLQEAKLIDGDPNRVLEKLLANNSSAKSSPKQNTIGVRPISKIISDIHVFAKFLQEQGSDSDELEDDVDQIDLLINELHELRSIIIES